MKNFFQYVDRWKLIVAAILALVGLVLLVFFSNTTPNDNTDGEFAAPDLPAFMSYRDDPYLPTTNNLTNSFIHQDLALFARTVYSEYGVDTTIPVEFIIKNIADEGSKIRGEFEKVNSDIEITFERLNNSRVKLSIVDIKTGKAIDENLASNNTKNQFIGTLPINTPDYTINYETPDFVVVSASFRDPAIFTEAQQKIKSLIGEEGYSQLNISITYPTAGFLDE